MSGVIPTLSPITAAAAPPKRWVIYVSYAWGDASPEGKDREAIVDKLCAAAQEQRGVEIVRDKTKLIWGDSITAFMDGLSRADRIFVILSEKYLNSHFCMYELLQIWKQSRQGKEEFLRRVRVYTLADADIYTASGRLRYAVHWKAEHDRLEAEIKQNSIALVGEADFRRFRLLAEFAHHVGDLLSVLADIVQPRNFDDLVRYGFDDLNMGGRVS
jgi:internalin A